MRILTIHNHYLIRGGEDESFAAEDRLLREMGHQVDVYEEHNERIAQLGLWQTGLRAAWSQESYHLIREKLRASPHDILHVQNFFPLISPSVYYAAKAEGVAVVQSLRNYRLSCPDALFFRDGKVCESCLGKAVPWPGVVHRCYRGSFTASGATAIALTLHRAIGTWDKMVDVYITPTEFAREKFIQSGLAPGKIFVKPNFVHPDPGVGNGSGGYALFVGRLSKEKGLDTLLAAWNCLQHKIPLKIVGDGPLANHVTETTSRLSQVEWLSTKTLAEVYELMGQAMMLIVPSQWYETFGRVVAEAFTKGTPVIASNIGATAELVDPGRTGLHFKVGDAVDLAAKVEWALAHPKEWGQMRQQARAEFIEKYTAEENYRLLMKTYEFAMKGKP